MKTDKTKRRMLYSFMYNLYVFMADNIFIQIILLIVGFVLLVKGADIFVEGAAGIADKFHVPQLLIGLTIVALGTSAPEAAVSIKAALSNNADITVGNVLGSNIINILIILGITSVIIALTVQKSTLKYEIPFMIFISIIFFSLGYFDGTISRLDGVIIYVFLGIFLIYLFKMALSGKSSVEELPAGSTANKSIPVLFLMTLIGLAAIIFGADITVNSASNIAKIFGMEERLIGLTVVAFGTSLPELMTSVTAGIKGKSDIAIGNIVGSNIFNILFVCGTTALITPVPFASSFLIDGILTIATAALLFICTIKDSKLKRPSGILFLVIYIVYFIHLVTA